MKKFISITLCILLTITLCSCSRGFERFNKSYTDLFDTVCSVVAYDSDQKSFDKHSEALYNELDSYNKLYDIYNSYDDLVNIKYINENAAKAPVKADKKIIDLLLFSKEMYELTEGAVNICLGSVLQIWHSYREEGKALPKESELKDASKHCDIDDLIINKKASTVYFNDKKMQLDVGAIAKGYAAEQAKAFAKEFWSSALINLGGNVTTWGVKPGGARWIVEIENPDRSATEALRTVDVVDSSVVTSGDYQRYYEVDGKRYCHIIDEKTLYPADGFSGVTVIYEDSAVADALSTALFILPIEEGKKIINSLKYARAVWVDKDYNIINSK
ncbi:MAG: FAD:protein FMN transferase [Eubacterium sp.]|nr:FAD:protein FMN transferase [Eubacterium sp.]